MASQAKLRGLGHFLPVLAALVLCGGGAFGDELIRMSRQLPGDSKPIILYADSVTTWTEGGQRLILLRGLVLIEHGTLHARMQQAAGWVDQERFKRTGIQQLVLYGEGDVRLENAWENRAGPQAVLELSTRGEIRIKSYTGRVVQQAQAGDPLFQRGQTARGMVAGAPATTGVQRVAAKAVAPGPASPFPVPPPLADAPAGPRPGLPGVPQSVRGDPAGLLSEPPPPPPSLFTRPPAHPGGAP